MLSYRDILKAVMLEAGWSILATERIRLVECLIACVKILITIGIAIPGAG